MQIRSVSRSEKKRYIHHPKFKSRKGSWLVIVKSSQTADSVWFAQARSNPQCRLRLFCFPYAGGGSQIFRGWAELLPPSIEVCPVLLPGRGGRMREPPLPRISLLVENIASAIRSYLDKPFAFFGHSMGALIGFELARYLRREEKVEPVHLFASACRAPQISRLEPPTYGLPDSEFLERLRNLNGTPQEVLEHPELMQLMLPLLRMDFEAVETYRYFTESALSCPISIYGGLQDKEIEREDLEAWREQTTGGFTVRMFDGDHFFIHRAEKSLLGALKRELSFAKTS